MKKFAWLKPALVVALVAVTSLSYAGWGIFHSRIIFNTGEGNVNRHGSISSGGFGDRGFIDHDFGVFRSSDTFILNGGDLYTFKNSGDDVCGGRLFYRVFKVGDTPGSFTDINFPFGENLPVPPATAGDQRWGTDTANIDLLDGRDDGEYVIEVFWEADGGNCGSPGQTYDSNPGNDWKAFDRINNSPGVVFKMDGASENKGGYATGSVTLSGFSWSLTEALTGNLLNDKLNGTRSIRIRRNGTTEGVAEMEEDKTTGVGTIGFNYARYGNEVAQPELFIEYSVNGGAWTQAGSITAFPERLTWWETDINESGNVRVRFRTNTAGTNQRRISIDDILLTDRTCVSESFSNAPLGGTYQARAWIGDDGGAWEATAVRTDLDLNGRALTFQNSGSPTLTAPFTTDGIGVIRFNAVRAFTNSNARSVQLAINGEALGAPITISATSDDVQSFEVVANVSGNAQLTLTNLGSQVTIDDLSWTCYTAPIETGAVSETEFILSDCNTTTSGTVAYTTNTSFQSANAFSAQLSDANGDFTNPLTIGSGASPIAITIPENLPSGSGYRIRVVSSAPAYIGTLSDAFEITQQGGGCPQIGDFRTRASGSWTNDNIWQVYSYNSTTQAWEWQNTNDDPDDPAVSATVRNGDTVTLSISSPVDINNLIVENGGQLLRGNAACGQIRYVNLGGDIVCDGSIGDGTNLDALGFNILAGDHTISGSGNFDAYRIRLSGSGSTAGALGSATLNIEMDVTLRWYEGACAGGFNAIYNDRGATAVFDVVVAAGATLTLTGAEATLGIDGANSAPNVYTTGEQGGGYTIFGTVDVAGTYMAGSNNAPAQRTYLEIQDGGVFNVSTIDFGDNNVTDGGEINLVEGALLNIRGADANDDTWLSTTSGSLLTTVDPLATVEYSRSGDQRIPSVIDYGHLVFTGSGERLLIDPVTVAQGDVTFGAGLTVSGADIDYVLEVGGDWTNNGGSFDAREGTVVFNGAGTQTIGGSAGTTFENLTMDGAGIDLAVNTNVHGVLAPESGAFDAQGFDLRLTSDADGTGSIGEIKSGASYSGNTVIERFIPSGVQFWVNLCSPIAGLTINDWNDDLITTGFTGSDFPSYAFNNVLQYDETVPLGLNDGFYGVDDVNDALDAVRGYFVYMQSGSQHVTVEGTIQQGSLTTPLEYTSTGVPENDGWELVANRYPSEIDFEALYNASSGIADHYYIYDADAGAYTLYSVGFGPTGNATGYIPSSQSFWVQTIASNAELNFEEDMKSATGVGFERSYAAVPRITMELSGLGYSHLTNVSFDASTTAGFDQGRDAVWFPSSQPAVPQLATRATGGQKLSLNRLAVPNEPVSVPIYVRTNTPGTYTFTVAAMAHLPEGLCLSIEDLSTGSVSAVAEGDSYDFEVPEPFEGDRFVLHLSVPMEVSTTAAACQGDASGSIEVQLWGSTGEVVVEDMTGAVLGSSPAGGWVSHTFDGLSSGGYVVRYISSDLVCESVSVDVYVEEPHEISTPAMTSTAAECTEATASLAIAGFTGGFNAMLYRDGELIGSYEANEALMLTGLEGALYEVVAYDACIESVSTVDLRDPNALNETLLIEPVYALTEGAAQIVAEVLTDVLATVTWYLDGEFIGTGQQLSHVVTEEGVYAYTVEIEGMHCSRTLTGTFEVQTASGVAGIASERVVLMTTSGAWMLSGLSSEAGVELDLYSADGRLVRSEQQQGNTVLRIDNENLARGIYTMVLRNADGTPVLTLKAMR